MKTKVIVLVTAVAAVLIFIGLRSTEAGRADMKQLGLQGFVQEEFDYTEAMHELYRHYEFANASFTAVRYEDAEAHLRVISFYVNLLPMIRLDKKFVRNAKDRKKFDKFATDLIATIDKTLTKFKAKKYAEAGKEISNHMTDMCKWCHNNIRKPYKDPTKFGTKPDFKGYQGGM